MRLAQWEVDALVAHSDVVALALWVVGGVGVEDETAGAAHHVQAQEVAPVVRLLALLEGA